MMEVIPLARNASHVIDQPKPALAIDFAEPAMLRKRSNLSDKVLIQIPKMSIPEQVADEAQIKIDTNNVNAAAEADEETVPVCFKEKKCGHNCNGVAEEKRCLPCLEPSCAPRNYIGGQDADQLCGICYTSELGAEACSKLGCGHVFHTNCVINLLKHKWTSLKISFAFMSCPQCNQQIEPRGVSKPIGQYLYPLMALKKRVESEALINAEKQGLLNNERLFNKDDVYYKQPQAYANDHCSFYECHGCKKPYFGGLVDCEMQMANEEQKDRKKEDFMCQDCLCKEIGVGTLRCDKHGTDQIDWKCQYCCSTALFHCGGNMYMCLPCHDEYVNNSGRMTLKPCKGVKDCPLGISHPEPTLYSCTLGCFPLGCGICRSEKLEILQQREFR